MSGGSYDYAYSRLGYTAADVRVRAEDGLRCGTLTPELHGLRIRFVALLERCADALHDIEWVDSDDYGPGDEVAALRRALGEGVE